MMNEGTSCGSLQSTGAGLRQVFPGRAVVRVCIVPIDRRDQLVCSWTQLIRFVRVCVSRERAVDALSLKHMWLWSCIPCYLLPP